MSSWGHDSMAAGYMGAAERLRALEATREVLRRRREKENVRGQDQR